MSSDLDTVLRLVAEHPGASGTELARHGLRGNDGVHLAELEASGKIIYVKDVSEGTMSGWYIAGTEDARLAQEQADARWAAWELSRPDGARQAKLRQRYRKGRTR